jgi:hypothetical protein
VTLLAVGVGIKAQKLWYRFKHTCTVVPKLTGACEVLRGQLIFVEVGMKVYVVDESRELVTWSSDCDNDAVYM